MRLRRLVTPILVILMPSLLALAFQLAPRPAGLQDALEAERQMAAAGLPGPAAVANLEVLAWEPGRLELWEGSGELAAQAGQWDEAIRLFQGAADLGVLSPQGRLQLGQAYLKKNEIDQALAAWQPLLEGGAGGDGLYQQALDLRWKKGDFPGVAQTARLWLRANPQSAQAAYRLGLVLLLDNPFDGLPYLIQAETNNKDLTTEVETLRTLVNKAYLEKDPGYQRVMVGRGLANLGYWDLAARIFEYATRDASQYAEGWAYLGEARQHLGQDGLPALQKALQLNPNSVVAEGFMALWSRRNGLVAQAIQYLNQAAAAEPNEVTWQIELGNSYVQAGDLFAAYTYFKKATEMEPKNLQAWENLLDFSVSNLFELDQIGQPASDQLLALAPGEPAALTLAGRLRMALGDPVEAERFLQQAQQKDAYLPDPYFYLGQLYLSQNRMGEAYQAFARAKELAETGTNIEILASRLIKQYFGGN
jgi:tetratricopeptide (TPR) repeat protein